MNSVVSSRRRDQGDALLTTISFAPPDLNSTHAGGRYFFDHVDALCSLFRISVFTETPNESNGRADAYAIDLNNVELTFLETDSRGGRYLARVWTRLRRLYNPWLLTSAFRSAADQSACLQTALQTATIVELQWSEFFTLAPKLRRTVGPKTKIVGVAHDVLTQRTEREVGVTRFSALNPLSTLRLYRARFIERRMWKALDAIIVFSQKDKDYMLRGGCASEVLVVHPSIQEESMPQSLPSLEARSFEVVFVADFTRAVNCAGAEWFIREVWHRVLTANPDATLVLAGMASDTFWSTFSRDSSPESDTRFSVSATGYVEDLSAVYKSARVAIVPLHGGAGVKFKTVSAMMWGLPVVATAVGAEGIGDESIYAGISCDPRQFARSVVDAIALTRSVEAARAAAFDFCWSRYSDVEFRRCLADVYLRLAEVG